jgi:hypothetical protein
VGKLGQSKQAASKQAGSKQAGRASRQQASKQAASKQAGQAGQASKQAGQAGQEKTGKHQTEKNRRNGRFNSIRIWRFYLRDSSQRSNKTMAANIRTRIAVISKIRVNGTQPYFARRYFHIGAFHCVKIIAQLQSVVTLKEQIAHWRFGFTKRHVVRDAIVKTINLQFFATGAGFMNCNLHYIDSPFPSCQIIRSAGT